MKPTIWGVEKLKDFIAVYKMAAEQRRESFWFEGDEYLTSYAKYVIEYLKSKFKMK